MPGGTAENPLDIMRRNMSSNGQWLLLLGLLWGCWGCGPSSSQKGDGIWRSRGSAESPNWLSRQESQQAFDQAGPIEPQVNVDQMAASKLHQGMYRVIPGDVLEFQMASILRTLTTEYTDSLGQVQPYACRVSRQGTITIPIVGEIPVMTQTLSQIEEKIVQAYFPKYLKHPPSVVGKVRDYRTGKLSIVGAIESPGVYDCRHDELSLVALIMKAGGIIDDGAARIQIRRGGQGNRTEPVTLPVDGLNIPFADVALFDGDVVEVERLNPEVFTVIGLVNKSGCYPYPPGVRYNLMQALAFAGGVNDTAAPEYVRIYRQQENGKIVSASFKLRGSTPTHAAGVLVKPGDVVAVEQTFSTRTRLMLAQVFRITLGVNARPEFGDF